MSKVMYMILVHEYLDSKVFSDVMYTDDMHAVYKSLKSGYRVFKLNDLTELKEINVSYEEVPKELS